MGANRHGTWLPFLPISRHLYKLYYYSFKIFLRFWMAKITHIIHHNQLLLTKFGRILPYWKNDVKSAAKLQIIEPLTKKTWHEFELFLKWVMAETFTHFTANYGLINMARTARRDLNRWHLIFGVYLQTWTARYLLNFPIKMYYRYELNIDRGKYVLTCF